MSSAAPQSRRLSSMDLAKLAGYKRPHDAEYDVLKNSLAPIDLTAVPQRKSLKRVYGPVTPAPAEEPYLANLRDSTLLTSKDKDKRYRAYVKNAYYHQQPVSDTNNVASRRIRFGNKQTVRIPKKTPEYKNAWRALKQHNRLLKRSIFPILKDEPDEDRTVTDQLRVDLPSDVEEETEVLVHSPTVVEEPIADIPSKFKVKFYINDVAGGKIRFLKQTTIESDKAFDDVLVLADDIAEEEGYTSSFAEEEGHDDSMFNTYVGVIVNGSFEPFNLTFDTLSHKLHTVHKLLKKNTLEVLIDVTAKSGGKRSDHKRKRTRKRKQSKRSKKRR